ncbi:MAG: hypothetical protein H7099_03500 [Gemmatimonadaceae bacterium]|nr:hypothetical protein [Gemmatimonadaceae bacterium]
MSPSVRAWLLLGVTLLLGICLGVLGGGAMQERRLARVNDIRRPGGFIEHVQAVIQPTEAQWATIRPLVEATAERNAGMRRMHDSAMRSALDSLRAALDPMLDDRQRERLARFVPGRPGGPPARRGRDGRPRGGRPPRPADDRNRPPTP